MKNAKKIAIGMVILFTAIWFGLRMYHNVATIGINGGQQIGQTGQVELVQPVAPKYQVPETIPTQGVVTNWVPGQFVLVAENFDPRMRIDVKYVTDAKWIRCQVKIDNRVFPYIVSGQPIEQNDELSSKLSNLEIPGGGNRIMLMVEPGQKFNQLEAHWVIGPKL